MPEFPQNFASWSHWGMFPTPESMKVVQYDIEYHQVAKPKKRFIPAADWLPRRELPPKR